MDLIPRTHFRPERQPGESFKAYRSRHRVVNKAVRLHLKGRLAFVSTQIVTLPPAGLDTSIDRAVIAGQYRDCKLVVLAGEEKRVGRTKGVTYRRYPAGGLDRREHRAA